MPLIVATDQPFGHMARQMNKLTEQLQRGFYNFSPGETWTPSVNLYETDTGYLVCVDLSGVDKEKIEITVEHQILRLRGQRSVPTRADGSEGDLHHRRVRVHLMEIDHGS